MSVRLTILSEPCDDCPWTGDFYGLRSGRLRDLRAECLREDSPFVCHKTVDYSDLEEDDARRGRPRLVAGVRARRSLRRLAAPR